MLNRRLLKPACLGSLLVACVSTPPQQGCEETGTCDLDPVVDAGSVCTKGDCTAPQLTLDPADYEGLAQGAVEVSGTVSDDSGEVKVEFLVDNEVRANLRSGDKWLFRFDTADYVDGEHTIVIRATDNSDNSSSLSRVVQTRKLQLPSCATGQFRVEHFDNPRLTGAPKSTVCNSNAINFDWGAGGPESTADADSFSMRWVGVQTFAAGNYQFTAEADDGVRVWVDGTLIIDSWKIQSVTSVQVTKALTAGEHTIIVEYFESAGSAIIRFNWAQL